jgi:hypothetical protein
VKPRTCLGCHSSFSPRRSDQETCGAAVCRQRVHRARQPLTDEDRAAIARVAELVPVPVPPLTEEAIRFHRATLVHRAERT